MGRGFILSFKISIKMPKNPYFTTHIPLDSNVISILVLPHMKQAGVSLHYQLLLSVFVVTALFVSLNAFPLKASALEISSQTQQILPPGSNTCIPISATNFTPYVYDGNLDSFEFTVPDSSYIAVAGSVGNTSIPFELMTRRVDASGAVHIHVDIASTPVVGTLPLQVTLISAPTDQPVCLSIVSMSVGSGPIANSQSAIPRNVPAAPAPTTPVTVAPPVQTVSTGTTTSVQAGMTTATSSPALISLGIIRNPLRGICASQASAYRLWLILLVLFAIIVGLLLWAEFPMSLDWARTPERIATIILVLLLLLLGFWYVSISCRAALWMPLLAFLIAILGLLAAFWNHPRVTQLLLIQDSSL
jgi:hypothetical protein